MDIQMHKLVWSAEQSELFRSWWDKIPHVPFKPHWDVRAVPPFEGAIVRYRIQHNGKEISVYLDAYDALCAVGQPYWEVQPRDDDDTFRCLMHEVADLVSAIGRALGDA
jgi:hypothetical protein